MPAIVKLFSNLDRLSPGSSESLRWALAVADTPEDASILDAGCGTGADLSSLSLAAPNGRVTALDIEAAFLDRVRARFPKVVTTLGTMLKVPPGPYDLIWSSGAIHNVGVTAALSAWRAHLAPGGCVAFSDLRARGTSVPQQVRDFWAVDGVVLKTVDALETEIAAAGYRILNSRWVGPAGWASFYGPLEAELDGYSGDPELVAHLHSEIALWRTHGVSFGSRLVVVAPH